MKSGRRIILLGFLILLVLVTLVNCKKSHKKITIPQLTQPHQTVFLSKFGANKRGANITLKYKKYGNNVPELNYLKVGILHVDNFYQHQNAKSCEQKQQFYHQTAQLKFFDAQQGMKSIQVSQSLQQNLQFIFIFNCQNGNYNQKLFRQSGLIFDILLDNTGLGMKQYGVQLYAYIGMIVISVGLCIKFWQVVLKEFKQKKNMAMILIIGGFVFLTVSVIFRFFTIIQLISTGQSIALFDAIYIGLKALVQVIMATILTSIAWGWLLHNPRYKYHFIGIVSLVTLLNIICQLLADNNKQQITNQHLYQGSEGKFVLFLRILNSILFISGCLYVSFQSNQKRQSFINNFAEIGAVYLLSNLIALLLSTLFAHAYRHGQVIPMLQDIIHLSLNIYLCYLFVFPKDHTGGYHEVGFGFQLEYEQGYIQKQDKRDEQIEDKPIYIRTSSKYQGKSADLI